VFVAKGVTIDIIGFNLWTTCWYLGGRLMRILPLCRQNSRPLSNLSEIHGFEDQRPTTFASLFTGFQAPLS
jgi:hypothetical protein